MTHVYHRRYTRTYAGCAHASARTLSLSLATPRKNGKIGREKEREREGRSKEKRGQREREKQHADTREITTFAYVWIHRSSERASGSGRPGFIGLPEAWWGAGRRKREEGKWEEEDGERGRACRGGRGDGDRGRERGKKGMGVGWRTVG